jgi:hypothetical protein
VSLVVLVLIICMCVKFFTVAWIFMHLKFDRRILTFAFYGGLATAVAIYVSVLTILNVWYAGHPHP